MPIQLESWIALISFHISYEHTWEDYIVGIFSLFQVKRGSPPYLNLITAIGKTYCLKCDYFSLAYF